MSPKKLFQKYTPEELADAFVFPIELSPIQKKIASKELAAARKKSQKEMTPDTKLSLQLYGLRFQLEDYLQNKDFDPALTFGFFLKQYVNLLRIKRKEFAYEISIDEALLSQFINMHRLPPEYIAIRLEIHSNNIIPAILWYKLVEKAREHELQTNKELRKKQHKYVLKKQVATG